MRNRFVRISLVAFILSNLVFISCPNFIYEFKISIIIDSLCEGRFDEVNTCQGKCMMKKASENSSPLASLLKPVAFDAIIENIEVEQNLNIIDFNNKSYLTLNLSIIPQRFYEVKTPPPRA